MANDRYILLDGVKIFVSEEVYLEYYRPVWREAKQRKVRNEMEYSLDALNDTGFEVSSDDVPIDEIVLDKLLIDKLYMVLAELTNAEYSLLYALYIKGKSEREVAKTFDISSSTVNRRKRKTLKKIKNLLKS